VMIAANLITVLVVSCPHILPPLYIEE
jgi:hypothetical protein